MKWKAPSERVQLILASPLIIVTVPVAVVMILPPVLIVMLWERCFRSFGPTEDWVPWFAWRPVCADDDPSQARWVWLEQVDRKRWYNRTLYRELRA